MSAHPIARLLVGNGDSSCIGSDPADPKWEVIYFSQSAKFPVMIDHLQPMWEMVPNGEGY